VTESGYKLIDHPSDIGMEVEGKTLRELFVNAAKGMLSIISDTPQNGEMFIKQLHLKEDSTEELLHSYLSEILWFVSNENFFPVKINISNISESSIDVRFGGIHIKDEEVEGEVKAITYHQLKVEQNDQKFFTKLIFDV